MVELSLCYGMDCSGWELVMVGWIWGGSRLWRIIFAGDAFPLTRTALQPQRSTLQPLPTLQRSAAHYTTL